jgi:predicted kinase
MLPAAPGAPRYVLVLCGLPATGKTTTAGRLHAHAGGVLIRSCDVYQALGISVPEWVRRTRGFTVDVEAYDRLRDRAYEEMARGLESALAGAGLVILDAVYGERPKREVVYALCRAHGAEPKLVLCCCEDMALVSRRFGARRGRESTPEHEASDLAVFRDIARRWQDPRADRLADGSAPGLVEYDTARQRLRVHAGVDLALFRIIRTALGTPVGDREN